MVGSAMKINEIEFVAGFCIARWATHMGYPINPEIINGSVDFINEQVKQALELLDNPHEFERDVMEEIQRLTGEQW
jgi:hypothetical protein